MISVSVRSNVQQMFDKIRAEYKGQVPFAASLAINEMASETRLYLQGQMRHYYDGGAVRYTTYGIYSDRSKKTNLIARVYAGGNDPHRIKYIMNTIDGGVATPRNTALTEPNKGKIRLTKVGNNIPKGAISRLSKKPRHFIIRDSDNSHLPSGLYKKVGRKGKTEKLVMLVAFTGAKQHKAVFPARSLATKYVNQRFDRILRKNLIKAISTMK
jgi:hypothetical protein